MPPVTWFTHGRADIIWHSRSSSPPHRCTFLHTFNYHAYASSFLHLLYTFAPLHLCTEGASCIVHRASGVLHVYPTGHPSSETSEVQKRFTCISSAPPHHLKWTSTPPHFCAVGASHFPPHHLGCTLYT